MLIILFLVSHSNFLFVPCGRLSWLPVSFLLHVKYPLSHSRDASRLNCLHGAIPIALAASDFPFRLLVDAVPHVLSVFRVCKVP